MRRVVLAALAMWAGCGSNAATNVLCLPCHSDADCGGNLCFGDVSGSRYCGAPCDYGCPVGFVCLPVSGTTNRVDNSCFPSNQRCAPPGQQQPSYDFAGQVVDLSYPSVDLGTNQSLDLASGGVGRRDLAAPPCLPPSGGTVTTSGGTVDRLYFGYTGDTRPTSSTSAYPQALQMVINNIFTQMGKQGVQFALDGGDHMEASSNSEAKGNMASYATAAALLKKPVFMTMGNHECATSFSTDCGGATAATTDIKMSAYMDSLNQVSGQTSPYYRVDIMTAAGKAVFLVVADDAWNQTQQNWLIAQLTDADANAKYTFVSKHHPDGNADQAVFQTIYNLVTAHKYTLFLTGHSHEYKHQAGDRRAVVMGLGGAPFDNPNQNWWGYLTVLQCPDDSVNVTVYDQSTGMVQDQFSVPPQ